MKELKKEIIEELSGNIPQEKLLDIEKYINDGKYRWAYEEMEKLKYSKTWKPTSSFLSLLEKFWWTYAN